MLDKHTKVALLLILLFTIISRALVINWGAPDGENVAFDQSMFYDSKATIRDQYRAMQALYHVPAGLVTEARTSLMPLMQRYIAAGPLGVWFYFTNGASPDEILSQRYSQHSHKTIFVNRVVSLIGSIGVLWIFILTLKRLKIQENLIIFAAALLAINPVAIGFAIHEKTITLILFFIALLFYFIVRWIQAEREGVDSFKYLFFAGLAVGFAAGAREQGLVFAGLLYGLAILWYLKKDLFRYLKGRRLLFAALAPALGLAISSPEFLVKLHFWSDKVAHPGRPWSFQSFIETLPDLWPVYQIVMGGSVGLVLLLVSFVIVFRFFKAFAPEIQILALWLIGYFFVFLLYPLKAPRFIEPFNFFGFILILVAGIYYFGHKQRILGVRSSLLAASILVIWFFNSLLWGSSMLAFFSGEDSRVIAAKEFHQVVPEGAGVAKYFRKNHSREIPIDEEKYDMYSYDHSLGTLLHSDDVTVASYPDEWPEYILIQREEGAVSYPNEQEYIHEFRSLVIDSGEYELQKMYPKRRWRGTSLGVFGTSSRWAYLNPVVEVYHRIGNQ